MNETDDQGRDYVPAETTGHTTTLRKLVGPWRRAECTCSWRGPDRPSAVDAENDSLQHVLDESEESNGDVRN